MIRRSANASGMQNGVRENWSRLWIGFLGVLVLLSACSNPGGEKSGLMPQFPSPMAERVREHERIQKSTFAGYLTRIDSLLPRPVDLFLPAGWQHADSVNLVVHFHGASFVLQDAAGRSVRPTAVAVVNLGSGSSRYEQPFIDRTLFAKLTQRIRAELPIPVSGVYLSAWSAGYGAVRAILKQEALADSIQGVLLLDGLHSDYRPPRKTLAEGGTLETDQLAPFVAFARRAVDGEKRMVITHSEIFPGTYASTTESSEYLIDTLGLLAVPVLEWGPGGMQLISRAQSGGFTVLGYAGNSAPDHVDHLHGIRTFIDLLTREYVRTPTTEN